MFDFANTSSAEYVNYSFFVDTKTNKPKNIKDLDKNKFPYLYTENLDPYMVFKQDNFLTEDECDYLVWLAETQENWPILGAPFWDERNLGFLTVLQRHKYAASATQALCLDIHNKMKNFVSRSFKSEAYADQLGINRAPSGSWQAPHIDNVPHLDRIAGCVVFLNDDFEGGEPFYPYYGEKTTPKKGMIYAHSSGISHLHGVTQIKGSTRYTISSTWTSNPNQSSYSKDLQQIEHYLNTIKPTQ